MNDQRVQSEATVESIIAELKRTHYWGSLELKFESGLLVLLRKSETLKLNNFNQRSNRYENNEHNRNR